MSLALHSTSLYVMMYTSLYIVLDSFHSIKYLTHHVHHIVMHVMYHHNVKLARDEMLPIPMLSLYWKAGQILTPAAPKSTCQTSLARWWKPTHVGGQDGTRSLLWVNRQLSCKGPVVGLDATYIKTVTSKSARGEAPVLRLGPLHIGSMQTF